MNGSKAVSLRTEIVAVFDKEMIKVKGMKGKLKEIEGGVYTVKIESVWGRGVIR